MKLIEEVDPVKLRGGYYTLPHVVDFCLERVRELRGRWTGEWLEPSAGDGAFLAGLGRAVPADDRDEVRVLGVELVHEEAQGARRRLREGGFAGRILNDSFFSWAESSGREFDVVVGNPPYVRYQFVPGVDRRLAEALVADLGITLQGVSNLWIPFVLLSLDRLRVGGSFALVLPSELFSTVSGGQFRQFLVRQFEQLSIDLFPRDTFAGILQDVVVVSGVRAESEAASRRVRFSEHARASDKSWSHDVPATTQSWLRYLLTEEEHEAFRRAMSLEGIRQLGEVARLGVAIVTGANPFFTVADDVAHEYQLHDWCIPLLARTADAPGVVFDAADHEAARAKGSRVWLLDFSADRPKPNGRGRVSEYLAQGEMQGLPDRYKCRIRKPWYRVPHIKRGSLMMTKRAHHYHRLLLNRAEAYTTDTIYRGEMRPMYSGRAEDLVAGFQNTLTLLSSEIEGRTYGGGVLELIPSEVARLAVPLVGTGDLLQRVDALSRSVDGQKDADHRVMQGTDEFLAAAIPGYAELLPLLTSARKRLQARRQDLRSE